MSTRPKSKAKLHNSRADRREGIQLLGPFHFPTNEAFVGSFPYTYADLSIIYIFPTST